jgi:hypothetical protein
MLLSVSVVVVWVRSYSREFGIEMPFGSEWGGGVVASRGSFLGLAFHFQGFYRIEEFQFLNAPARLDFLREIGGFHGLAGFMFRWEPGFIYAVAVPLWALLLFLISMLFLSGRLRVRRSGGNCVRCGYDLTGNTSGTCPECGYPA